MNEILLLTLLAGRSPAERYSDGFVVLERWPRPSLICQLCRADLWAKRPRPEMGNPNVMDHGLAHIEAARSQVEALAAAISISCLLPGSAVVDQFSSLHFDIFGFAPGTPAARQFWQTHGGLP